jgi:hypothetical protein
MNTSRTRGLRPNPHTLGVTPLKNGEASRPIRVRAKLEVFAALAKLNATQIGELLEKALTARNAQSTPIPEPVLHFTRAEAYGLMGRKVRILIDNGHERKGNIIPIFNVHERPAKDGYELELGTGLIITKNRLGVTVELI